MGTVGLSFGSPTSGAGFDVSSTVAEIVSNLQNVETPWKNQLSALQKQDTVISNLGSLFSNLSNDIGSLTDFQGVLAQKEGSSSDNNVLQLTAASSSATAGTHSIVVQNLAQTSSGYLDEITNASDALSGSLTVQVGSGKTETIVIGAAPSQPAANTIYTGSGAATLSSLVSAINSANLGVTANVLTDSTGSRLSLVSNASGAAGQLSVTSNLTDAGLVTGANPTGALSYNPGMDGKDASLVIDGVPMTSASNTVSNLIPGVTFQLLAPSAQQSGGSLESVQVVIANDNSGVETAINQFVSDYNALMSAINTQEGNDSSGNPEPLFGSPTLSLLQQELLGGLNTLNPNGYLDAVSSAGTTLSGSMTIQVGNGTAETVVIGAATDPPAANTIYTGSGSDFNTISGLVSAINAANMGVTAAVLTQNGESTLTLTSQMAGSAGALTVTSALNAATPAALGFVDSGGYSPSVPDSGALGEAGAGDSLSGTVTIQVGGGSSQTFDLSALSDQTLSGLSEAINAAAMGVTASVVSNSDGTSSLSLSSNTAGAAGALTVTSNLYDTLNVSTASLNYTASSGLNNLTSLGIGVNNDGSLTFDANSLDSLLNTDYSSIAGFFQNANSWGQTFNKMLAGAGVSSSTGILKLAQNSNSTTESTLNAEISRQETYISAQQSALTAELNQANQILQELPSKLDGMNQLYSAITGYNQNH
jgi:flagellar hook-associated protein 2